MSSYFLKDWFLSIYYNEERGWKGDTYFAKIFKLDMFTCGVASLANIGGSASAPILAGAYSGALVPVGVLMALMGYVIGTGGGIIVARIMSLFA